MVKIVLEERKSSGVLNNRKYLQELGGILPGLACCIKNIISCMAWLIFFLSKG
jgi:hypothetical protein